MTIDACRVQQDDRAFRDLIESTAFLGADVAHRLDSSLALGFRCHKVSQDSEGSRSGVDDLRALA